MMKTAFLLAAFAFACPLKMSAADEPATNAPTAATNSPTREPAKEKSKDTEEKLVQSKHTVTIDGQLIHYTASTGTIFLRDEDDKPTASIFYIAYTRDDAKDLTTRPVTFSFNGGPGSSSVWMHLGMLGPRRIHLADDGSAVPPPYKLVDNEYSLLDESDLVFIDPVSTGFSRAIPPKDGDKFHSLRTDTESVAEFIRLYVTRHGRWTSPKFIIGESYGTTRAAALSADLESRLHMNVNGIMLVSTVLNFETISFGPGNDLPYVLFLPSYATTAWYHHRLSPDLQQLTLPDLYAKAQTFAAGPYSAALFAGSSLDPAQRKSVIEQYAQLTGLKTNYVDRANLRVPLDRFAAELLAEQDLEVGRYDGRYKGYVRDRLAGGMERDPSYDAVSSTFASTFNTYIRSELNYETDVNYVILGGIGRWTWDRENAFVDVAENLANAMTANPFLKIHVSCGYYDLATPIFATRYTFDHMGIDPALLTNITLDNYTAGHMMYLNLPDLKKSKADLARFVRSASTPPK